MWPWRSSEPYRMCSYIFIGLYLLHVLFTNAKCGSCAWMSAETGGGFVLCFHFWKNSFDPHPSLYNSRRWDPPWKYSYRYLRLCTARLVNFSRLSDRMTLEMQILCVMSKIFCNEFFLLSDIYAFWTFIQIPLLFISEFYALASQRKYLHALFFLCARLGQLSCNLINFKAEYQIN